MYVMHKWHLGIVYAQQRQTFADLTQTHARELDRAHIVLEHLSQASQASKGACDDLELRETFSWACGVAGRSLTSTCHPAALSSFGRRDSRLVPISTRKRLLSISSSIYES